MERSRTLSPHRTLTVAAVLVLGAASLPGTAMAPAEAQTVTVNWVDWVPPAGYPNPATIVATSQSYDYATTADGELQIPNGPLVYVRLTGEVVDPALLGAVNTACSSYCGPSGFTSNGTTRSNYWQTYPYSRSGAAFTSANVPFAQLPPTGDHIGLVGASVAEGGNPTQTLQFFSDAARTTPASVRDIVMLVGSLGSLRGNVAVWDFTQDFDILSDNGGDPAIGAASTLQRTVKSPGGTGADYQLSGQEGTGAIQFIGEFTELSWTVSAPEVWASWNISASSARAPSAAPAAAAAAATPPAASVALECAPDPVRAGASVTCEVTEGEPGFDILWRASLTDPFAEAGVTLDPSGRGSFSFTAPSDAVGSVIAVELVDWGVSDTVAVSGTIIPSSIPAGGEPGVRSSLMNALGALLALVLAGLSHARGRREDLAA